MGGSGVVLMWLPVWDFETCYGSGAFEGCWWNGYAGTGVDLRMCYMHDGVMDVGDLVHVD